MRIIKLKIKNFKGIKKLVVDFLGKDVTLSGKNGTGKTSIMDAITWLLFDKDSIGRTKFNLKPVGSVDITSNVEAEFVHKGEIIILKKEIQYSKHKKDIFYFVQNYPKKATQYTKYIEEKLIDEKTFKILSNPLFFPSMHWKEQRDMLTSLIKNVDHSSLIKKHELEQHLCGLLTEFSMDEIKKNTLETKKTAKEKIASLDAVVEELRSTTNEYDYADLQKTEKEVREKIASLENKKMKTMQEYNEKISKLQYDIGRIDEKLIEIERKKEGIEKEIAYKKQLALKIKENKDRIEGLNKNIKELKEKYLSEISREFVFNKNDVVCKTCGQELPDRNNVVEKLIKNFENEKNKSITTLIEHGKTLAEYNKRYKEILDDLTEEYKKIDIKAVESSTDENNLKKEKEMLLEEQRKQNIPKEFTLINSEINEYELLLDEIKAKMYELKRQNENKKRIESLEDEIKFHSDVFLDMSDLESKIEGFMKDKISLYQDSLNNLFSENITFKLFNDTGSETFEICYKGIPYSVVNTASKVNLGLEIIEKLKEIFGFDCFVLIDNIESINNVYDIKVQKVCFEVSDRELTVRS
jgi:DNA repair exonuclease SbcCD ATPase subunit